MLTRALFAFFLATTFTQSAAAQTRKKIDRIVIDGLTATKEQVVLRELGVSAGDTITDAEAEQAVQRIRNLAIFNDVNGTLDDRGILRVTLKERWTLIPIAKFASGGGVNRFVAGVYNSNLFGLYKEAGAQYERLGETNSGVIWFRDPWFVGNRYGIDLQLWNINRLRTKYQPDQIDPVIKTGFLQTRRKAYLGIPKTLSDGIQLKPFVEHDEDEFSDRYLTSEILEKVQMMGLPPETKVTTYGLQLSLGSMNYNNFLQDGLRLELTPKYASVGTAGLRDFFIADASLQWFRTMFGDHTLAFRAGTGSTDTQVLQYWNYFGGLSDVRGFSDNRFAGRAYWLTNTEWRFPFYRADWLVLQHVSFFDSVATAEYFTDLTRASGSSVGMGLRFIAPKVYRLVARIDVAKPVVRRDKIPVSFGVQQFF